jgi:hypothetical protein
MYKVALAALVAVALMAPALGESNKSNDFSLRWWLYTPLFPIDFKEIYPLDSETAPAGDDHYFNGGGGGIDCRCIRCTGYISPPSDEGDFLCKARGTFERYFPDGEPLDFSAWVSVECEVYCMHPAFPVSVRVSCEASRERMGRGRLTLSVTCKTTPAHIWCAGWNETIKVADLGGHCGCLEE